MKQLKDWCENRNAKVDGKQDLSRGVIAGGVWGGSRIYTHVVQPSNRRALHLSRAAKFSESKSNAGQAYAGQGRSSLQLIMRLYLLP